MARSARATSKGVRTPKRSAAAAPADPADDSAIIEVPGYGKLTERQRRFAQAYRNHGNATRAAQEAGYHGATPDEMGDIGYQLLRNVKVRWYIAFLGRDDELQAGDILDMLRGEAAQADHAGARVRAQELLGKTRGMFSDDVNVHLRASDDDLIAAIAGQDQALSAALRLALRGGVSAEVGKLLEGRGAQDVVPEGQE